MTEPNFRSLAAHERNGNLIYRGLFAGSPSPYLVLTPDLVVINANDAFMALDNLCRDQLVNRFLFDVFPDNPTDPTHNSVRDLTASFDRVRRQRQHDSLFLRYDGCYNGIWRKRYWHFTSWPIIDDDGAVIALIHNSVEITDAVDAVNLVEQSRQLLDNTTTLADDLQGAIDRMHLPNK